MTTYRQRVEAMEVLGKALDDVLYDIYGQRMGYALFSFPFGPDARVGDWISNAERADMIKFMREIAKRLEDGEDMPKIVGEA